MNKDTFNINNDPRHDFNIQTLDSIENAQTLILFNDDINSFDFVINSLIEVCNFDTLQAEQCATIAHYNGKCPLIEGKHEILYPMYKALQYRKLTVEIS